MLQASIWALLIVATMAAEFTLINNSKEQDVLVYRSATANGTLKSVLVKASQQQIVSAEDTYWSNGRIFGRIDCLTERDCAKVTLPTTKAVISYGPGFSTYSISEQDGFNIKLSLKPTDQPSDIYRCKETECVASNILEDCPTRLAIRNAEGTVIACASACYALDEDVYCCRGDYDNPEMCKSEEWPVNYAELFIKSCPYTRVYPYDNQKSVNTCPTNNFTVVFL